MSEEVNHSVRPHTIYAVMSEDTYFKIPKKVRDEIRDLSREPDDYEELKKDGLFCELYKNSRKAKNELNDYKFKLRNK